MEALSYATLCCSYTASYQSIHDDITNIIASWEKEVSCLASAVVPALQQACPCGGNACQGVASINTDKHAPPRPQMPNKTPGIWFVGHSDGSQLAQLAALKYATSKDAARVGGVVLFGPSRVGSRGFANFFNSVLGGKMVYYYYGRDPASTSDYTVKQVSGIGGACWWQGRGEGASHTRAPVRCRNLERTFWLHMALR